MFCKRCGLPNAASARFCANCGSELGTRGEVRSTVEPAPPAPVPDATLVFGAQPAPGFPQAQAVASAQAPAVGPAQAAAVAPAQAAAPPAAVEPRMASIGDRLIAVILDAFVLIAAFAVAGMWVGRRMGGVTESGFSLTGTPALITISVSALAGFVYYWLFEGLFGATLGKGIAGIQVRRVNGGRCGLGASLVRNLLRIVDGIGVYLVGFLAAIFSKRRQRLGDHAAGTIVVSRPPSAAVRVALVIIWLGTIGGGLAGAYILHRSAGVAGGKLAIANFALLDSKGGAGRASNVYKPGATVFSRFDVAGSTTDDQGQVDVQISIVPLDPAGVRLYEPWQDRTHGRIRENVAPNWSFQFDLPDYAPPGAYRIEIQAHDGVKNTDVKALPAFTVEGPAPAAAPALEMRGFQFSTSEGGPPQDPMVLKGGGVLYMSAQIAGMQFQQDRPAVGVALQVVGPGEQVLVDAPKFLDIAGKYTYHPPTFFVKMNGRVTLPPDVPKGTYTAKYTITDSLAGKTVSYAPTFEVQ